MLTTRELEREVLAGVLCYGRDALAIMPDFSTADLAEPVHREVFAACVRVDQDGLGVALTTVGAELSGNSPAIHILADIGPGPLLAQLPGYVRKLRTLAALRRATAAARKILALEKGAAPPEERLVDAQRLAQEILAGATSDASGPLVSFAEVADEEISRLDRIRAGEAPPERLQTCIADLDAMLYVQPGDQLVIAGETSSGKSSLCGQITAHEARRGRPVVFVTSEMTHRQMLIRIVSGLSGESVERLVNPKTAALAGADRQYRAFRGYPIHFQRKFPPRIEEASAAIRTAVARHGAKLAVIDYAQRLAEQDEENQERAIARIAHEAKNLALELGIVVIAAAQVNRQVSGRTDPRPKLSDLRGSGRLEQDADVVLFTYQPSRHGKPGDPEIIVSKQRNGRTGIVPVSFNAETCTFHGLEEDHASREERRYGTDA